MVAARKEKFENTGVHRKFLPSTQINFHLGFMGKGFQDII